MYAGIKYFDPQRGIVLTVAKTCTDYLLVFPVNADVEKVEHTEMKSQAPLRTF